MSNPLINSRKPIVSRPTRRKNINNGDEIKNIFRYMSSDNILSDNCETITVDTNPNTDKHYLVTDMEKLSYVCNNILLENQREHFIRIVNIIEHNGMAFDTSILGAGKTIFGILLSIVFNKQLFVITPNTVIASWHENAQKLNIDITNIIGYDSTRRQNKNNEYLQRADVMSTLGKPVITFVPTEKLKKIVNDGCILILDEIQNVRNADTLRTAAVKAIGNLFKKSPNCGIYIPSGLPAWLDEHAETVLRVIGIIKEPYLCVDNAAAGTSRLLGIDEFIKFCETIDYDETRNIRCSFPIINSNTSKSLIMQLFARVILKKMNSCIPTLDIDAKIDLKNGFYDIHEQYQHIMMGGINDLKNATSFDSKVNETGHIIASSLLSALVKIECAKIATVITIARRVLDQKTDTLNPKVIICLNYNTCGKCETCVGHGPTNEKSHLKFIAQELNDAEPVILSGQCRGVGERERIINTFQNDDNCRVLISNIAISGTGLNLHDTDGNSPRVTIIMPSHKIDSMHQAGRRGFRTTSKSNSFVRIVYGNGDYNVERSILKSLWKKSNNMKLILNEQAKHGTIFPSDYADVNGSDVDEIFDLANHALCTTTIAKKDKNIEHKYHSDRDNITKTRIILRRSRR